MGPSMSTMKTATITYPRSTLDSSPLGVNVQFVSVLHACSHLVWRGYQYSLVSTTTTCDQRLPWSNRSTRISSSDRWVLRKQTIHPTSAPLQFLPCTIQQLSRQQSAATIRSHKRLINHFRTPNLSGVGQSVGTVSMSGDIYLLCENYTPH